MRIWEHELKGVAWIGRLERMMRKHKNGSASV